MITIHTKQWKPQLLANDKAGEVIDWEQRLPSITDWMVSHKYDGARVEIIDGIAYSRELKVLKSKQVQDMAQRLYENYNHQGIIEAEFWSPEMNWSELMHFFKTEDVTSSHTIKKYTTLWNKTNGVGNKWKFPGRDLHWCINWHNSLKFYVFDEVLKNEIRTKEERYGNLYDHFGSGLYTEDTRLVTQLAPTHIDQIYQAYDQVILDGGEGLVVMKKKSLYKPGRITLKENTGYKIKESNIEFHGMITGVEEGTVAREGAEKTINAFGRSKTSQLKEDRIPSGMAKGFFVKMDDGRELTVSFNGFNWAERKLLLQHPGPWIGKCIMFTGANPVKVGGNPRHAHYTREDVS